VQAMADVKNAKHVFVSGENEHQQNSNKHLLNSSERPTTQEGSVFSDFRSRWERDNIRQKAFSFE
jgi:hypothetical protein